MTTVIGKTPFCLGRGQQTTKHLPPDPDIPEAVIKASSSQVSNGPAGPFEQEGSGGGITPQPASAMGSGAPAGIPDNRSCNSSNDEGNQRPTKDATSKDCSRYYRRRQCKQRADI
jgi:hypothetical protein